MALLESYPFADPQRRLPTPSATSTWHLLLPLRTTPDDAGGGARAAVRLSSSLSKPLTACLECFLSPIPLCPFLPGSLLAYPSVRPPLISSLDHTPPRSTSLHSPGACCGCSGSSSPCETRSVAVSRFATSVNRTKERTNECCLQSCQTLINNPSLNI